MINEAYKTETIEQHGTAYRIEWVRDYDHGAPWEEEDGHGPVSDWERREKRPGEMILNDERGARRFYDFAAAVKQARREGWSTAPYEWKTKGEQAAAAALADFDYLRRWCNDEWYYCGIIVTVLNDEGEETDNSSSLWGIEDDGYCSQGYHATVIQDIIREFEYQLNRLVYPVTHCGV